MRTRAVIPHTLRAIALAACAMGMSASNARAVDPVLDNPNRDAVSGVDAARRFFHLASTRRVEIAIIGDGNMRREGTSGHEDGMTRAFATRLGMFATRINPCMAEGDYAASPTGETSEQGAPFVTGPLPSGPTAIAFASAAFPHGFAYLPEGQQTDDLYTSGLHLTPDSPIGITGSLRYNLTEFVLIPGAGSYALSAREPLPGNILNTFAEASVPSSATFRPDLRDLTLDIPAGPRSPMGMVVCFNMVDPIAHAVGPLVLMTHRVERLDHIKGIAVSPLWMAEGQDTRDCLQSLLSPNNNAAPFTEYWRQLTRLQNGPQTALIQIIHGGADINDTAPSLGPTPGLPSNTSAGHKDNCLGIINALRAFWIAVGYDPANLFFLLGPYHPRGDNDAAQSAYAQAWRDIAAVDPQVFTIDGTRLCTSAELAQRGYLNGADALHLSPAGYTKWGSAAVSALSRAVCPGDYTEDGNVAVQDIFAMLSDWFAHSIRADFNGNGVEDVADIFAFLSAWFEGC